MLLYGNRSKARQTYRLHAKASQLFYVYRVGQKTGPFLTVDNVATVSGKTVCYMSKVHKFCLKKYKACIAVCLNILCLICLNIHYP